MEPLSTTTGAGAIITAALSSLTPLQLSSFTTTISAVFHHHHHRLSTLLSSHTLFSLSLHHLHSLSLHQKSLLIARHLLSILSHFLRPPPAATILPRRDLDSVLLLLLLCEVQRYTPNLLKTSSPLDWRASLSGYFSGNMLTLSGGVESSITETLIKYIGLVTKCRNFVGVTEFSDRKERKVVAAAKAVVVALPSVVVERGGEQCVICKEEMKKGIRDVCELPCDHRFHWMCILPWLEKRNTCPYCRHQLPTDDVYGELERQWEVLVKMGGG